MSNHYNPSDIFHSYWVYCLDEQTSGAYPNQDGKWMMFFPLSEMDRRWGEACSLYRAGKLTGINSMKASTAKQNPMPQRLHGPNEGIIIFYCGPSEFEANVMEYGRNILNNMFYPRSEFCYKSDKPHLIDHSKYYKNMYQINTHQHYNNNYSRSVSRGPSVSNMARRGSIQIQMQNNIANNIARTVSRNETRRYSVVQMPETQNANYFMNGTSTLNTFNPRPRSYSVSQPFPSMPDFSRDYHSSAYNNSNNGFGLMDMSYPKASSRTQTPLGFGFNFNQFLNSVY